MTRPPERRVETSARGILAAAGLSSLALLAGCDFNLGPDWGGGDFGAGCTTSCVSPPWATPYFANILRGDTVRFIACNDYQKCTVGKDTGHVAAAWSLSDTLVAALQGPTSSTLVPSATNVLVRGVGRGTTYLKASFTGNSTYSQYIRVADTSDIKSIELPAWGLSDTVRTTYARIIPVQFRDVSGNTYRIMPTSWTSSDTTILKVAQSTSAYDGSFQLSLSGVKQGKASVTVTWLSLSATLQLTVVP